jgi:hypothetical protein
MLVAPTNAMTDAVMNVLQNAEIIEDTEMSTMMVVPANDTPTNVMTDTLQNSEIIERGVSTFLEVVSPLISDLDQLASVHPFIKGASPFYHAGLIVKHAV